MTRKLVCLATIMLAAATSKAQHQSDNGGATPQDVSKMVNRANHSLAESIAVAERHSGGKAVRAECCIRKNTMHAGTTPGNENDPICKVYLLVGDNRLVEVCVNSQDSKVLGQRDVDRLEHRSVSRTVTPSNPGITPSDDVFAMVTSWQKGSDLVGKKVTNSSNEDLGKIEDIVVDAHSGRILYGVLSFGGFLGMGDKLFAIPWHSLGLSGDEKAYVLNVDKDRLKKASGFDKSNWPNFADEQFATNTYQYYNERPYWQTGHSGVQPVSDDQRRTRTYYRERWNQRTTAWQKLTDLMGKDCKNHKNEDIGEMEDVAIDSQRGRIIYGVLEYKSKLFAIPYAALTLAPEYKHFVLNVDKESLKENEGFTKDTWPSVTDPRWANDTFARYNVEPYWR